MESNWRFKSLENLEKKIPVAIEDHSHLVVRCNVILNQPLNEYSIEDIRIMIGQQIGLDYLIPLALEQLNIDVLSEGDYYPGDLLTVMLKVDKTFWKKNSFLQNELNELVKVNKDLLLQSDIPSSLLLNFM
jgi:hypothetical protein